MRDQLLMVNGNRAARIDKDYDGTIYVGNYFETRYYNNTIDPPPPITEGDNPVDSQPGTEPTPTPVKLVGDVSYYYAGSQRIAMRIGNETYFLFGDHLGSTSVVLDANGQIVEKGYYMPWGGTRGEETITSTDYGYTGQMREGDIYYYGARWYDPAIGRFMQADTIVPLQVQGTQAFDRYAYVNNNPLRFTDPSGHWYINGWEDEYLINQGNTNKSAIYSLAMGLSIIYGSQIDVNTLDNGWLWTDVGIDWGIPPALQPSGVNPIYRNAMAYYTTGGKAEIIDFLSKDLPVVVTFAFPFWGHSVLAIGYEPDINQLIFADPATGTKRYETEFLEGTRNNLYKKYPWTDPMKTRHVVASAYNSTDNFLRQTDIFGFVPPRSLTVITRSTIYHGGYQISIPPLLSPGGRNLINDRLLY